MFVSGVCHALFLTFNKNWTRPQLIQHINVQFIQIEFIEILFFKYREVDWIQGFIDANKTFHNVSVNNLCDFLSIQYHELTDVFSIYVLSKDSFGDQL